MESKNKNLYCTLCILLITSVARQLALWALNGGRDFDSGADLEELFCGSCGLGILVGYLEWVSSGALSLVVRGSS